MARINDNYLKLPGNYLFAEIAKRRTGFQSEHPEIRLISLGIGDVTRPLPNNVTEAMHKAVDDMSKEETFKGYSPDYGYEFLIQKIIDFDYKKRGVNLDIDEIFLSDGAKSDTANIQEIFGLDNIIAVTDPVYPVYIDSNVMAGRTGEFKPEGMFERVVYMPCNAENGFIPEIPGQKVDMIYLCYPNNPTGMTITNEELKKWVDYAKANKAVILYDSAYEAYINDETLPHSIYEIDGAEDVAIEFRSFSKTAGFTGIRCAYVVVPKSVMAYTSKGEPYPLNKLWARRQSAKFNGVSYVTQRGAAAIYSDEGQKQIKSVIDYYMTNAKLIRSGLEAMGFKVYGGINAPYIWVKTPGNIDSWVFFDKLLNEVNIIGTPGAGFGPSGQGYLRLTAFGSRGNTEEALERIKTRFKL